MTATAWGLVVVTLAIAGVDWFAVATQNKRLEYVAKPATMLPLIALAATLDAAVPAMVGWFIAALVFGLIGDVFLMLERDEFFVFGLGSFLIGHLAYVVGLTKGPLSGTGLIIGTVLVFTATAAIGPTVVTGALQRDRRLAVPVTAYIVTISVMVVLAFGTTVPIAILGALLFLGSDFVIGWSRFVQPFASAKMVIIVTYHLGQLLLVISMAIAR